MFNENTRTHWLTWWRRLKVRCRTYDREAVHSTIGRVAIKRFLLGWVNVCRQVGLNHVGI